MPSHSAHEARKRRLMAMRFLVIALLATSTGLRAMPETLTEAKVKDAFVYNFAKFVDWPPNSFESPGDPFTICTAGKNPLSGTLDEIVKGKAVDGHPVATKHLAAGDVANGCQILFISPSENGRLSSVFDSIHGTGVLTVGDAAGFSKQGGMIAFVVQDNRVRFLINLPAAEKAGLKISSRLLTLAVAVER
ncbi:MAG: YfiR family protein [Acidobacteriota bacterium]|nr:YfiR family protein [Acidobacteriota bacterium]